MRKFALIMLLLAGCFFITGCSNHYSDNEEEKPLLMGQLVVDEETGESHIEPFYAE